MGDGKKNIAQFGNSIQIKFYFKNVLAKQGISQVFLCDS